MNRQQIIEHYRQNPSVPVLIIGAGINGIGTFRDLALQGVDVLMVDRSDYVSGASSASSHMVHGGIRYLENGEFRLVREAVKERNRLIENAPQHVKPLATTIPIFKWGSGLFNAPMKFLNLLDRPSERGALVIKAGLTMYDTFTMGQDTVPKHDFNLRKESLERFPDLNPKIVCTATYYDAAMPSPERIAVDILQDGKRSHAGAHALNYVSAVGAENDRVIIRDELTGEEITIQPEIVINAAGPWIDFANRAMGKPTKMMGGTKGSHLVLNHPELYEATQGNEIFFENEDGRIVLIYPFFKDRVLVGTSDIKIDNPDDAVCTDEEIDYFLDMIDQVFPSIEVDPASIVFKFSGVRPLPNADEAKTTGQISRDHKIEVLQPGEGWSFPVFNLIGGKWTTFRAFSEQVTDKALWWLGRTRTGSTAVLPVAGAENYPKSESEKAAWIKNLNAETGIDTGFLALWLERYGTHAAQLAQFSADRTEPNAPLAHHPKYSNHEIAYLTRTEDVIHVEDILLRRTLIGMLGETTLALLEEVTEIIGTELGWSESRRTVEMQQVQALYSKRHGMEIL